MNFIHYVPNLPKQIITWKNKSHCLDKVKESYTSVLDYISGQSLDEAIQSYTRIHEKRMFNKQIATYRYILIRLSSNRMYIANSVYKNTKETGL